MIAPSAHRNRHLRSLCELGVLTAQRRRSENFSVENFSENHLRNAQETHKFDRKPPKMPSQCIQNHFPPYLCYLCVVLFKNPFPERSVPILLSGFLLWPSVKHRRHSDQSGTKRNAFVPQIHCTMVQKRCKLGATLRKQPSLHPCLQFCGNIGAVVGLRSVQSARRLKTAVPKFH